ncbi:unnamed protein product [Durusdinium trenchii]|uniref:Uncharacterized protein n=2 Tax=Durusdinium trenchii TaxID=1381693 RepID=A0ABP0LCU9_9DINO
MEVTSLKATHLPPTVDEAELRSLFGRELCSLQLPRRSAGENCGYAILGFTSPEAAEQAMRRNGQRIPDHKAVLRLAPCQKVSSGRKPLASYQVCVGNLAPHVSDAELYTTFRSLSENVVGARVPVDQSGRSRGFGFLRLSDEEAAEPLVAKAHGFQLAGRAVTVRQCLPADSTTGDRALFISNLEVGTREDWLRRLLGVFGELDFVDVGIRGGFARVGFIEAEAALGAASLLQGRAQNSGRRLLFRWAKPLSTDPQGFQAFSQRFATPAFEEHSDNMARELAKSLLPVEGPALPSGAPEGPANKIRRIGEP